jgi:adenylosuccinate synthase
MKAYAVVDLGYGDAGKGTTVDFLSRLTPNTLIVRYNGGPQAAHNVVTAEGLHHTFAQFGSGTFVPSVKTYLSKYMWIEPLALLTENEGLLRVGVTDALSRLYIDKNAQIVTPFHKAVSRLKERKNRHGSCGTGMGEAVSDSLDGLSLTIGTLDSPELSLHILKNIQEKKIEESKLIEGLQDEDMKVLHDPDAPKLCYDVYDYFLNRILVADGLNTNGFDQVIFEGAGGVLLDENYGFHPHTMWTTTTTENVRKLWKEEAKTLGIIRTYSTRHGNGPFVSEGWTPFIDQYNTTNEWQGGFRTGLFDLVATKYALKVNGGVDALVVTHTDENYPMLCDAYTNIDYFFYQDGLTLPAKNELKRQQSLTYALWRCKPHITELSAPFTEEVSDRLGLPIFMESFGARSCDKKLR